MLLHFSLISNEQLGEETDERRSLAKIPDMFNKLVKEKGPLGAVRTTVALLMQES